MRTPAIPQRPMDSEPLPGTTEAIERGCTCQVIAHESAGHENEPAGVVVEPDPNCPLHGATQAAGASSVL